MSLAFIICTEKGVLEKQSVLLALSIRWYAGIFSRCPIYSFSPRKNQQPSAGTKRVLRKLNVTLIDEALNHNYVDYPLANKPLICAYGEQILKEDTLVFLDSDKLFLNEPLKFSLLEPGQCQVRPVDFKGIGISQPEESRYWQTLFQEFNVDFRKTVTTTVDRQEILPYFNTGMIATKRLNGLFQSWKDTFEFSFKKSILPEEGIYYLEQSTFAVAVGHLNLNFLLLPDTYNFPYHLPKLRQHSSLSPEDFVSIHYHKILFNGKKQKIFQHETDKFRKLNLLSTLVDNHIYQYIYPFMPIPK